MTSKTYILIGIVALLVLAGIFIFSNYLKPEQKFPEIKKCIMGVDVDFNASMKVNSVADAETAFGKFIAFSRENNQEIFGYPADQWKAENATIHGTYQGKKYWAIQGVFDVSEDGEVVRLLGCI